MEQVINQLFKDSSTIIFPHLGAIIKIGKGYQFNEFLKYNDGKLVAAVEEVKGISKEKATALVSDYIRTIKEHLNAGKAFQLATVGKITKKGDKIIIESEAKLLNTEKTIETISTPPINVKKESVSNPPKQKDQTTKTKSQIETDNQIDKEDIKKQTPVPNKEEIVPSAKPLTSANLVIEKAIEKINSFSTIKDLEHFTKDEKRSEVLNTIKTKTLELNTPKNEAPKIIVPTPPLSKNIASETKKPKIGNTPITTNKEPSNKKKDNTKDVAVSITKTKKEDEKIEQELITGAIVIEKEAKKRKRNRLVLWLAILLLLIGTSIMGYLKKDSILGLFNSKEIAEHNTESGTLKNNDEKIVELSESEQKEIVEDKAILEQENHADSSYDRESIDEQNTTNNAEKTTKGIEEITEVETEIESSETSSTTSINGKYNIIVGSFSSITNAEQLVDELKAEGFSNARTIENSGKLTPVSIENYSSREDAKGALNAIKDKGYSGWIKKI